jgi:hypothetical protein
MTYLTTVQQASKNVKREAVQETTKDLLASESDIRAVEISFYDHEIYAGDRLIASITHDSDDFVTQRWVVMINGLEIYRSHTWGKSYNYITWHYKEGTLPVIQEESTTTENAVMVEIATECEKYEFEILNDGIHYNDTKLGEVGCTNERWWVIRASCPSRRKVPCDWHHRAKTGKLYAKAESLITRAFQRYLFSLTRKGRNLSKLVACFKFHT